MKKLKYIFAGALVSIVLSTCMVIPTFSWLSSKSDEVVNTFEGNEIKVRMDESPVDKNGKKIPGLRVTKNSYKFTAGSELDKDPTPAVLKGSMPAYVFVYLENKHSDIFALNVDTENWLEVAENDGQTLYVYKTKVNASEASEDMVLEPLFTKVKVSEELTSEDLEELKKTSEKQFIKTQTYAIQAEEMGKDSAIDQAAAQFGFEGDITYVDIG